MLGLTMSATCDLCQSVEVKGDYPICGNCRYTAGRPFPPSRRPLLPCQRCQHTKLVRVVPREYTASNETVSGRTVAPMTLTQHPNTIQRAFFKGNTVETPDIMSGVGTIEAYVCGKCGFIEWYCQDPEKMPIGPAYNTELVDVSSDSPYR
jgi:hypothetical protein